LLRGMWCEGGENDRGVLEVFEGVPVAFSRPFLATQKYQPSSLVVGRAPYSYYTLDSGRNDDCTVG